MGLLPHPRAWALVAALLFSGGLPLFGQTADVRSVYVAGRLGGNLEGTDSGAGTSVGAGGSFGFFFTEPWAGEMEAWIPAAGWPWSLKSDWTTWSWEGFSVPMSRSYTAFTETVRKRSMHIPRLISAARGLLLEIDSNTAHRASRVRPVPPVVNVGPVVELTHGADPPVQRHREPATDLQRRQHPAAVEGESRSLGSVVRRKRRVKRIASYPCQDLQKGLNCRRASAPTDTTSERGHGLSMAPKMRACCSEQTAPCRRDIVCLGNSLPEEKNR